MHPASKMTSLIKILAFESSPFWTSRDQMKYDTIKHEFYAECMWSN